MNMSIDPQGHRSSAQTTSQSRHSKDEDMVEIDILQWIAVLWEAKFLILGCIFCFGLFGAFSVWRATPIYQSDAMIQIGEKKAVNPSDAVFARIDSLFSETTEAQAEIEIIKSNLVLGRTIEALHLDVVAKPVVAPIIGAALLRRSAHPPKIEIDSFEIPESLRGEVFRLTALGGDKFKWEAPAEPSVDGVAPNALIATGSVGEIISAKYGNENLTLKVKKLSSKIGQKFVLSKQPIQAVIGDFQRDLELVEKGKMTNIIGVSLDNPNPIKCAEILNEIINQYLRHKLERKTGEASKAVAILQAQLPPLKAKLDEAESRLSHFRSGTGSVDMSREGDLLLQQSSALLTQISALKQKKEELLRTYQENSDVVSTLNNQLHKLQNELNQTDAKLRVLPGNQQELIRLTRDVQVNTDLYTAMLNNYKQLQIASAGDVGNVTVVDSAVPNLNAVRPKKTIMMIIFLFLGTVVGIGLTIILKLLRHGIEDHRIIESQLGLQVFVTVPHSDAQEEHDRAISNRSDGIHLVTLQNPDDLATEGLRSLRTILHFSMGDQKNRVVMITGPSPSIGKSFISSNLAAVLSQAGSKVLLVDGDLRRGNLHHYFGHKSRIGGLSEILSGRMDWRSAICSLNKGLDEGAENTQIAQASGLSFIKSGIIPPDPSELLMSEHFTTFISETSAAFDYVIIDAPPLLPITDASIIGSKVGIALLVAKYGQHSLDELRTCKIRLESLGIPLKGCIFNDVQPMPLKYGYQDYRYAYHYKYK